ncbi:hypothetical protein GCM10023322_65920 [Rugosimonospora acidiphila]|uniref:AB hydrolase-1 domain-containing protein n=1 Tax=Rugosimonospora acidiphila TaxID=556531 RepID=A0ABP9SL68_9ACTN
MATSLLDRLGLDRFSYCGVSLGGMVGMWLAAQAPSRVDRLALCCTSARFDSPDPWRQRADRVRREGSGAIAAQLVARWFTPPFVAGNPDAVRDFEDTLAGCTDEGYAACCEAIAAMDLRPVLPTVTAPTAVIAGAMDPATPPSHGKVIADAIPGARLHVVPDAAHLANVERPGPVTAILIEHLVAKGIPDNVL